MNTNILVSVITVAFNSEKTISKAIESVLGQTYKNIEYIIVDGASSDKTVDVANGYKEAFEKKGIRYTVISEPDNGMYDAINKGIDMAAGFIIGCVNSDDFYEKDAIENVVYEYINEPYDMIYGDLRIIKKSGNVIKKAKLKRFVSTRYWNHPTTFITKDVYSKEKYKCVSMYDDLDLMLRLRRKNYKVRVVNKILSNFVFGGMSNVKDWRKAKERIKLRNSIYRNNGYGLLHVFDNIFIEIVKYLIG